MLDKLMTPETEKLFAAFEASDFDLRFVGGCVRDALLGVEPKDVDFCTNATPDEMRKIATNSDFKFLPTGVDHGTATLVVDGVPFEVTTLRVDVETDGRKAEVVFTRSFEADAERRDLTINAMSMDRSGMVYDYFGGREDLKERKVRFVGVPELRIQEDYLRILRYFRFAARFDAHMDVETLSLFRDPETLDKLNIVSVERFWQEMQKLMDPSMPGRVRVVDAIFKTNVNRALGFFRFNPVEVARSDDSLSALASLIYPQDIDRFFDFWKMSSAEEKKVRWLVANRTVPLDQQVVEVMLTRTGVQLDYVVSLLEMMGEPTLASFARDYVVPTFPVTGKDLIAAGMAPGPEMGRRLERMKDAWMYSGFTKDRDALMEVE